MTFYVDFTSGNDSTVLHQTPDRAAATTFAETTAAEYKAAARHGVIALYALTTKRGIPAREIFKIWEV